MFFLQDPTPDTSGYMIVGYIIAFAIMGMYLASLIIRWRNLNQDQQLLEEMEKESSKK